MSANPDDGSAKSNKDAAKSAGDTEAVKNEAEAEAGAEEGAKSSDAATKPVGSKDGTAAAPAADASPAETPGENATPAATEEGASPATSETKDAGGSKARTSRRKRGDKVDLTNVKIGILGAGKMAEAITTGLITHTKIDPKRIYVSSKSGRTLDTFREKNCVVGKRTYDLFAKYDCDVFFLCIHGYVIRECFSGGGSRPMALTTNFIPNMRHPIYLLSLIGGVQLGDIKSVLLNPEHPEKYKLEAHRIMLNGSVAYGIGLGALDVEPDSKKCAPIIRDIITTFAKVELIPENNIDVACAVGGNGQAFCYYFVTALSDGGFKMGLPKALAVKLAAKTLQSAALSLLESGKHPTDLRDQSTSPSGPAIYGIHVMDKKDCASGLAAAVENAFKRIHELANDHPASNAMVGGGGGGYRNKY